MGDLDGIYWVVDWLPVCLLGLLLLAIAILISSDFLTIKVIPMRTCPKCHRSWVPLPSDPKDQLLCNTCRLGIRLGLKKKEPGK